jgi:hypothetical protein
MFKATHNDIKQYVFNALIDANVTTFSEKDEQDISRIIKDLYLSIALFNDQLDELINRLYK